MTKIENNSGITPLEYNVLIEPERANDHVFKDPVTGRELKIHKPDEYKDREQISAAKGRVLAISPLAFNYDENAPKPEIGDEVLFPRHNALIQKGVDGQEYFILKDKVIAAIITAEPEVKMLTEVKKIDLKVE